MVRELDVRPLTSAGSHCVFLPFVNELLQMLGCVIVSDKLPSEHHVLIDNLIYALAVLGPRTSVI
jgi:hypothetical protein